jgi:hypothetical protein
VKQAVLVIAVVVIWTVFVEWVARSFQSQVIGTVVTVVTTGHRVDPSVTTGVADFSTFFTWVWVAGLASALALAVVSWGTGGDAPPWIRSVFTRAPLALIATLVIWSALSYAFITIFPRVGVCSLLQPVVAGETPHPMTQAEMDARVAGCNRPDPGILMFSAGGYILILGVAASSWLSRNPRPTDTSGPDRSRVGDEP